MKRKEIEARVEKLEDSRERQDRDMRCFYKRLDREREEMFELIRKVLSVGDAGLLEPRDVRESSSTPKADRLDLGMSIDSNIKVILTAGERWVRESKASSEPGRRSVRILGLDGAPEESDTILAPGGTPWVREHRLTEALARAEAAEKSVEALRKENRELTVENRSLHAQKASRLILEAQVQSEKKFSETLCEIAETWREIALKLKTGLETIENGRCAVSPERTASRTLKAAGYEDE
mgnify:CR=1 FL=1|jgi:hypothetical protein